MKDPKQNQMVQNFGEPFFLAIYDGDTLAEVKLRIQKKLKVPDEEFSKWKFALLSLGRPEYLQDSDVISSRFQRRVHGALEEYLGLEHSDITPKSAYQLNQAHPNAEQYCCKLVPNFENSMINFENDPELEEVNIDDQDPLLLDLVEKETSIEQNKGSIEIHGDEIITASKLDYKSSTSKTYAERESKIEGLRDESQMLNSIMDVIASTVNRCTPRMVTEKQLFEEVERIDGLSEFSQIISYDFLCGDAIRGRTFIGLPLTRRKQWLEFKLGQPLD